MTTPAKAPNATNANSSHATTSREKSSNSPSTTDMAVVTTATMTPAFAQWQSFVFTLGLAISAVFPIALGVGSAFLKASTSSTRSELQTPEQSPCKPDHEPVSTPRPFDRKIGDQLFDERRYEVALSYYRALGSDDSTRLPPELGYRIALCQEGLGHWEEALEGFRAVSDATSNSVNNAVAGFAQARLLMRLKEPARAAALLRSLIFREGGLESLPKNLASEIVFLLPLAQAQEVTTFEQRKFGRGETCSFEDAIDWPLATNLSWIEMPDSSENSLADGASPEDSAVFRLKKPTIDSENASPLEDWKGDFCFKGQTLRSVLQQLAKDCEWSLDMSSIPGGRSLDRVVYFQATNLPICWALTSICSELKSTWALEGNQLSLHRSVPSDSRLRAMIAKTLTSTIASAPANRQVRCANFALAQLMQLNGRHSDAADAYSSIVRGDSSPLSVRAAYNAAINYFQVFNYSRASALLEYVVAAAPESELRIEALLLYGRLLLDNGDVQNATFQFRRAAEPCNRPADQARAAVLLGLSLLADGKPHEAAEAILAHKSQFNNSSVRNGAAFITSFARWQALTPDRQDREAPFLYRSVLSIQSDTDWLGLTGKMYIGRALAELGFKEEMVEFYSRIPRQNIPNGICHPIDYELAENEFQTGHPERAEEIWKELASEPEDVWTNRARMRLVELAFAAGKFDECLESCRSLLNRTGIDPREIRQLMGRIYEAMGDDAKAAKSYSGQIRHK